MGECMTHESTTAAATLARVHAAARDELRRRPQVPSWRREAVGTAAVVLGTTALVIGVGAWLSIVEVDRLRERLLPLMLLVALQALGVFAAIAPGRAALRWTLGVVALGAAVAMLVGRGDGTVPSTPAFACSTSHVAVDLIPLGLALFALRRFAWTLGRSLLAGVATAATGAIAGELSCGRGWTHALVHHIGAGLLVAVVCVLVSRARRPLTYAP
ncbi:MAG TPA: hypothetical protein VHU40_20885 [Polyangia bacterium]|nr:hypothetical protein [Polyangia bacterium]